MGRNSGSGHKGRFRNPILELTRQKNGGFKQRKPKRFLHFWRVGGGTDENKDGGQCLADDDGRSMMVRIYV